MSRDRHRSSPDCDRRGTERAPRSSAETPRPRRFQKTVVRWENRFAAPRVERGGCAADSRSGACRTPCAARRRNATLDAGCGSDGRRVNGSAVGAPVQDPRLAAAVYGELSRLAPLVSTGDRPRPFAVVAADGRVVAGNRPLFELLGCPEHDLLGSSWSSIMPMWEGVGADCAGMSCTAFLLPPAGDTRGARLPARLTAHPVHARDGAVVAHTVFVLPSGGRAAALSSA